MNSRILWVIRDSLLFIMTFLFCTVVKKAPPVPPSKAQAIILEAVQREDYFGSLRRLFRHQGFILLMITYGK